MDSRKGKVAEIEKTVLEEKLAAFSEKIYEEFIENSNGDTRFLFIIHNVDSANNPTGYTVNFVGNISPVDMPAMLDGLKQDILTAGLDEYQMSKSDLH